MQIQPKLLWLRLPKEARDLLKDPLVRSIILLVIGHSFSTQWIVIFAAVLFVWWLIVHISNSQIHEETKILEEKLYQPDPYAVARVALSNDSFLVFSSVVEIYPHPSLLSKGNLLKHGWSAAEIQFDDLQQEFDASEALRRCGGLGEYGLPNGKKYCLADTALNATDVNPKLFLKSTNFFTIESVKKAVRNEPKLRTELGSFNPHNNKIPHSLCLHYIVRYSGGQILLCLNDKRKAYAADLWSCSGEEQLKPLDVEGGEATGETLFKRAVCEEVFALNDDNTKLETRWQKITELDPYLRIWSLFVEEELCNFSLFGLCQLSGSPAKHREVYERLVKQGGARDIEGKLYIAEPKQIKKLLYEGRCKINGLFNNNEREISCEQLHKTSRYRIFRLLRALGQEPLQVKE